MSEPFIRTSEILAEVFCIPSHFNAQDLCCWLKHSEMRIKGICQHNVNVTEAKKKKGGKKQNDEDRTSISNKPCSSKSTQKDKKSNEQYYK